MNAAVTLVPVFFMVVLGQISRQKHWISMEQKEGANKIVFELLFPMMIFNVLFTTDFSADHFGIVAWVFFAFGFMILLGQMLRTFFPDHFSTITPYMLTTTEGGNVALPLYTSIVGMQYASNTIVFDIAGSLIAFIVVPVLISRKAASALSFRDQLKTIFSNSFVIAVLAGILLNVCGLWGLLENSVLWPVYTGVMNMVTAPIAPLILFIIGFNLSIHKDSILPIMKLLLVRVIAYGLVIAGFFCSFLRGWQIRSI